MTELKEGAEPIPGYRLERQLGRGTFGEVWKTSAPGGTAAALKFIDLATGDKGLKEFRGNQRVLAIRHPHLMPLQALWLIGHDGTILSEDVLESFHTAASAGPMTDTLRVDQEQTRPNARWLVLAMSLGDQNLEERMREAQEEGQDGIPPSELLQYMEEAAKGIDFLNSPRHDLGSGPVAIQHCDIKPANIMLVGGSVVICDFSLANLLTERQVSATATSMAGSPVYMAPDLIQMKPSKTTDQYSLAITYYQLRTGLLPFDNPDPAALDYYTVTQAHINGTLNFSHVAPAEQQILRKATAVDPLERFDSCAEMVAQLNNAAAGKATQLGSGNQSPSASAVVSGFVFLTLLVAAAVAVLIYGPKSNWFGLGPKVVNNGNGKKNGQNKQQGNQNGNTNNGSAKTNNGQQTKGGNGSGVGGTNTQQAGNNNGTPPAKRKVKRMFAITPTDAVVKLNDKPIKTDAGKFTFEHLEGDPFSLTVSRLGYLPKTLVKSFTELEQLDPLTKLELQRDLVAERRMEAESLTAFQQGDSQRACEILKQLADRDEKFLQPPVIVSDRLSPLTDVVANNIGVNQTGDLLAVGGDYPTIRLLRPKQFPQLQSSKVTAQPYSYLTGITLSGNGQWLAAMTDDTDDTKHHTLLWDLSGATPQQRLLKYHSEPTQRAKFSADSKWLATSTNATEVAVWKLTDLSKPARVFSGHGDIVYALAVSRDGQRIVVVGDDQTQLCEVAKNATTPLLVTAGDTISAVKGCEFCKKDQVLAVAAKISPQDGGPLQRQLLLYDFDRLNVAQLNLGVGNINGLRTYDDEVLVFDSTQIYSWKLTGSRLPTGPPTKYLRHAPNITGVARDSTGKWLVSCSTDKSVIVWQRQADGQLVASYVLPTKTLLYDVAVVEDKWLVAVGNDAKIFVWDFVRCQLLLAFQQYIAKQ